MTDRGRNPRGPDEPGDSLEHELADLGSLMARQEQVAGSPPSQEFAAALRARLMQEAPIAIPVPPRHYPRWRVISWVGVAGILAAAVLVVVFHLRSAHAPPKPIAAPFMPPTPGAADLTKSYPNLGGLGGGGGVNPFVSQIETVPGEAYPGRITLTAGLLPSSSAQLPAYRLQRPASALGSRVRSLARTLGIEGTVRSGRDYIIFHGKERLVRYLAIVQGARSRTSPLRSVAISAFDGRLIFHDSTSQVGGRRTAPPASNRSVSVARAWLTSLGWPGPAMPLQAATVLPGLGLRQIAFGWPDVPHADTAAATLWINHNGQVTEALVFPRLARSTTLPTVPIARAWSLVRAGHVPIGVDIINPRDAMLPGSGRLRSVTVEQILTTTNAGAQYLVPAYDFEGSIRIVHTSGRYHWVALVPAVRVQ